MRSGFVSVFLICGLLAGCRSDGEFAEKPAIRLATTGGSLLYMPVYLAKALGFYEQEGVSVVIDEFASAPRSMQSLVGGSSDVAAGGFMSVVSMNAERRPVQAFLLLVRYPAMAALVSP